MLDLRHSPRAHVCGHAIVHASSGIARCEVENLSVGGVLVRASLEAPSVLVTGTPVIVELYLAGTAAWVEQPGWVRWRDRGGVLAIAFEDVSAELEDEVEDEVLLELEAARSPRVLIVDRSLERRHRLATALRRAGKLPLEASTPLEAIEFLEECHEHLDGAAVAGELTQTGGKELVQFLQETHPNIRIAIITDEPPASSAPPSVASGESEDRWSSIVRTLVGDRDPTRRRFGRGTEHLRPWVPRRSAAPSARRRGM